MAKFYFKVRNDDVTPDHEGADLDDLKAAHAYAIKAARSLAAETVIKGHLAPKHRIDIEDKDRNVVGSVTFGEAVDISPTRLTSIHRPPG